VLVEDWGGAEVPSAAVVGPRRQAAWLRFQSRTDQVNISFFPGAAGAFVGLPLPELVGRMAAPDDVWPHDFRDAVAELEPLPAERRVPRLAGLLLARLEPRREPPAQVREAVRLIRAHRGCLRVRWLAHQVNLSVSQLEAQRAAHPGPEGGWRPLRPGRTGPVCPGLSGRGRQDRGRAGRLLRGAGLSGAGPG